MGGALKKVLGPLGFFAPLLASPIKWMRVSANDL